MHFYCFKTDERCFHMVEGFSSVRTFLSYPPETKASKSKRLSKTTRTSITILFPKAVFWWGGGLDELLFALLANASTL